MDGIVTVSLIAGLFVLGVGLTRGHVAHGAIGGIVTILASLGGLVLLVVVAFLAAMIAHAGGIPDWMRRRPNW